MYIKKYYQSKNRKIFLLQDTLMVKISADPEIFFIKISADPEILETKNARIKILFYVL